MQVTRSGKTWRQEYDDYRDDGHHGPATVYWRVREIQRELGRETQVRPTERLDDGSTLGDGWPVSYARIASLR